MNRLNELFRRDEIKINRHNVRSIRGITSARRAPNNRADLNTVDQFGAQMANQVTAMAEHAIKRQGGKDDQGVE